MSRHADLRRRQIEGDLNHYDHYDISEALFRLRRVTMSQQKSRPRADDSHDTTRSANKLGDLYETEYHQTHNTCTRSKPRDQVAQGESDCAYRSLQRRTQNVERKNIEKQMGKTSMQEERR